jgi:hypothetical protein
MSKVHSIGIICEDNSDFDSIKEIIRRIVGINNLDYKKQCGEGSSRIRSKCSKWAEQLKDRGCQLIIVVHDLDRENHSTLEQKLTRDISTSGAPHNYVCIPIEELEAWFIANPETLKSHFNLNRLPPFRGNPENILSPKEAIKRQVRLCSGGRARYINTTHNPKLAERIDLGQLYNKSQSYKKLHDYLLTLQYR